MSVKGKRRVKGGIVWIGTMVKEKDNFPVALFGSLHVVY